MYPISQVQEPYSVVGYLAARVPLFNLLRLLHPLVRDDSCGEGGIGGESHPWSAWDVCDGKKELSDNKTSNSNHRLKSAVDMPMCVLKRGDLCDRMSSRENETRFLHQNDNEVNLRDRDTKWPRTSICSACICIGSPTQTQN